MRGGPLHADHPPHADHALHLVSTRESIGPKFATLMGSRRDRFCSFMLHQKSAAQHAVSPRWKEQRFPAWRLPSHTSVAPARPRRMSRGERHSSKIPACSDARWGSTPPAVGTRSDTRWPLSSHDPGSVHPGKSDRVTHGKRHNTRVGRAKPRRLFRDDDTLHAQSSPPPEMPFPL